jgi:DNA processing protein
MDEKFIDTLRLIRTENVGPITFYKLIRKFKSAKKALEMLPELSKRGGKKSPLTPETAEKVQKEIENSIKKNIGFIPYYSPNYPPLLKTIEDAPPVLTYKGKIEALKKPAFAIVGSRNSSLHAKKFTKEISRDLCEHDLVIASGMAYGIDTQAHKGALSANTKSNLKTVAVLAGGADYIYPQENEELYNKIIENGCIISEMPISSVPQAKHFPRRNRIISGISAGSLIIEANLKSGSLITARFTLEQSRDLFAIPGFPTDPRAKGTNKLIKNGAYLTETEDDIIKVLKDSPLVKLYNDEKAIEKLTENLHLEEKDLTENFEETKEANTEKIKKYIIQNVSHIPISINEIKREIGCKSHELSWALLELELAGKVLIHPGNKITVN